MTVGESIASLKDGKQKVFSVILGGKYKGNNIKKERPMFNEELMEIMRSKRGNS